MSKKAIVKEYDWDIGKGYGVTKDSNDEYSMENTGYVLTHYGIAKVTSIHWHRNKDEYSIIEMIKDGRMHIRQFNKFYSRRYLVTLAKRFAKDLFEKGD